MKVNWRQFLAGCAVWLACGGAGWVPEAAAQTATFDFDTATPVLNWYQNVPFDQTVGNVTAHFSAASGGFSVQNYNTTFQTHSLFFEDFLSFNVQFSVLDIVFNQFVTNISLAYVIGEATPVENPTPIELRAYRNSAANPAVGMASSRGTYIGNEGQPSGTLTFNANGQPFNMVRLALQTGGVGLGLLVDNITVDMSGAAAYTIATSASPTAGGSTSGGGLYTNGESVSVTATANAGYAFVNWTENGNPVSTAANYACTASTSRTLVANFVQRFNIATSSMPANGGSTSGGGIVDSGASVTVAATANAGYAFVNWTQNGSPVSTAASYTFTANANRTLVANFIRTYAITVDAVPTGGGTVSGGGIYNNNASVTLTASPSAGYAFLNWTEAGIPIGSAPVLTFTATAGRTLVANFVPTWIITADADPVAGGSVSGGGTYNNNASVALTASPSAGYAFLNWTEGGTPVGSAPVFTFTATASRTLVANFVPTWIIAANAEPVAGGSVSGAGTYTDNASVTLTASPSAGYAFLNWTEGGTPVGSAPVFTFTATASRTLVANFVPTWIIAANAEPVAGGSVSGAGTYTNDANVTLTASPNTGYAFLNWTEGGTAVGSAPVLTFTATAGRTLVANFVPTWVIAANAEPVAGGSASGAGTYTNNASVTLTASPSAGYAFVNWTEGGTTVGSDPVLTFTATTGRTLVANFVPTWIIAANAEPVAGGSVSGAGTYTNNASVTLTASPSAGYAFLNWTEAGTPVGSAPVLTLTATAGRTLVANFVPTWIIAANAEPIAGGLVTGAGTYTNNASVTLTASPSAGYAFLNWTEAGAPVSSDPVLTFTATAGRTLVANFVPTWTIAANAEPVAGGSVSGAGTYTNNASVTLTASPSAGYSFLNWTEAGTPVGSAPVLTFTATAGRTLVANFAPQLNILLTTTNTLVISWPAPLPGYVLQENPALDNAAGWTDHTSPVEIVGGVSQVTVSPAGARFYRLFRR